MKAVGRVGREGAMKVSEGQSYDMEPLEQSFEGSE